MSRIKEWIIKRKRAKDCISRSQAIFEIKKLFAEWENDELYAMEPNCGNIVAVLEGLESKIPTN